MRKLKYREAISEATVLAMRENPKLFLMGEGIDDPKGSFGTTLSAFQEFGSKRVIDTPLSENAITGIGIGAAIAGYPCMMIHLRSEFLLLAMDQIVNHAAKWHYMFAGQLNVPIVIRCIIGRGWGQAAQHSQSFHAFYSHVPGLKVILPATAYDAKGLLYSALKEKNPVICIEHRWLHEKEGEVPEGIYEIPIGKAKVVSRGTSLTCVAVSYQVHEALAAREKLLAEGIDMEVIDLRSTAPLDIETILESVKKTGKLLITDIGHKTGGISAEISASISEVGFKYLKAPITRVCLPDFPTPCSYVLEDAYYPKPETLMKAARALVAARASTEVETFFEAPPLFTGPF